MDRPNKIQCVECDELLTLDQPAVIYDDEWCHIGCAADAQDNDDFDSLFFSD